MLRRKKMTLVERLNKELSKYELQFVCQKEYGTKFKGFIIEKNKGAKIPYELEKSLQVEYIEKHCKWINDYVDLYLKLKGE
jgi:hypothetical protein